MTFLAFSFLLRSRFEYFSSSATPNGTMWKEKAKPESIFKWSDDDVVRLSNFCMPTPTRFTYDWWQFRRIVLWFFLLLLLRRRVLSHMLCCDVAILWPINMNTNYYVKIRQQQRRPFVLFLYIFFSSQINSSRKHREHKRTPNKIKRFIATCLRESAGILFSINHNVSKHI